jgi:hypothetical protein
MNVQYSKALIQDKMFAELYKMVREALHLSELELKELEATAKTEPAPITWKQSKKDKNKIVEGQFVPCIKHLRPFQDKTLAVLYKMVCEALHLSELEHKELEAATKTEPAPVTWK